MLLIVGVRRRISGRIISRRPEGKHLHDWLLNDPKNLKCLFFSKSIFQSLFLFVRGRNLLLFFPSKCQFVKKVNQKVVWLFHIVELGSRKSDASHFNGNKTSEIDEKKSPTKSKTTFSLFILMTYFARVRYCDRAMMAALDTWDWRGRRLPMTNPQRANRSRFPALKLPRSPANTIQWNRLLNTWLFFDLLSRA